MRSTFAELTLLAAVLLFAAPHIVSSQEADLGGEWVTANPVTRGITRIVISREEFGWVVRSYGKCHPIDCDWGQVPLYPVGASVEDHSFASGFAVWDPGFATKYVTMARRDDILMVETVTIFKDQSRRANFRAKEVLRLRCSAE